MTKYYLISEEKVEKMQLIDLPEVGCLCSECIDKHNKNVAFNQIKQAILSKAQEVGLQEAFDVYIQLRMLLGDEFLERAKSLGKDYQDFESFLKSKGEVNGI